MRSGIVYLSRILNFLRSMNGEKDKKVKVPLETLRDIQWWKEFAPIFNGTVLMLDNVWSEPDAHISSDSCLTGGGAFTDGFFFHFEFPDVILKKCNNINQLECVVLVIAVAKWASLFTRRKIQSNCDNQVTVQPINTVSSKDIVIQECLRYLHKVIAITSIDVRAVFIRGVNNRISDSLSRWHLSGVF